MQPGSAVTPKIVAAYRPILFRVSATNTNGGPLPPVVYCDVYINDLYYKSLSATQYASITDVASEWLFDISDICQEALDMDVPLNGGSALITAQKPILKTFCRFRASGYNASNFVQVEGVAPQQSTGTMPPVAGTGLQSETFMVLNAVLQHEDNQDLVTHLSHFRRSANYKPDAYPGTHRPAPYFIGKGQSDYFPVLYLGDKVLSKLCLSYRLKGQANFIETCFNIPQVCNSVVSNVTLTLLPGNLIQVTFESTPPATIFEYAIDGGSWQLAPGTTFFITYNDLLQYLITESGQPVLTDDTGEIIIPEDVDLYDVPHTIEVRPRCSNGVYGTSDSAVITIDSAAVCNPPELFEFVDINYGTNKINFNITLPAPHANFQLAWSFDYGGYLSGEPIQDHVFGANPFAWDIPPGYPPGGGSFRVKIRTKCGDDSFSGWSPELIIPYNPPLAEIIIEVDSIVNTGTGTYRVIIHTTATSMDPITVEGYFVAEHSSGSTVSFNYTVVVPAGMTTGTAELPNAAPGGAVVYGGQINNAFPDPTSDSKNLVY